ncbi:MAG: type IV toxin-antitoxin system AbiEi family antitoxin domain-containing protein, partial [Solirubrobacteraceae bacterium]
MDASLAALAARQHGVVAREQLSRLALGRGAVDHRLATGRLHVVHRGVFAVGHPVVSRHGRWIAAVLAAGHGAVLSHRSAAALWALR